MGLRSCYVQDIWRLDGDELPMPGRYAEAGFWRRCSIEPQGRIHPRRHRKFELQSTTPFTTSAANSMRSATPKQQQAMMAKFRRTFDDAPDA